MLNIEIKEDSAEKLAAVQGKPTKNYLFAQELNEIVAEVNALDASINPDRIISLGTETIVGNEYTYEGYTWQLGGVQINNIGNPIQIVLPSATTGFKRNDISVFKADGTIERIAGIETDGEIVSPPDVPEGTLYFKTYFIDGNIVESEPEPPVIDGSIFKKKSESAGYSDPTLSGSNAVIQLRPEGYSLYAFSNAGLVSIDGFGLDLITGNPSAEVPYPGKDILIYNNKAGNLTLKHDGSGTADVKFLLEGGVDLIIPAGGKVWLKYGPSYCEMIFKSWSDVKEVIEGYFNGTKFYTDALFTNLINPESGKIYVNLAVTPATQYRWSGSNYILISDLENGIYNNESQLNVIIYQTTFQNINYIEGIVTNGSATYLLGNFIKYTSTAQTNQVFGYRGNNGITSTSNSNKRYVFWFSKGEIIPGNFLSVGCHGGSGLFVSTFGSPGVEFGHGASDINFKVCINGVFFDLGSEFPISTDFYRVSILFRDGNVICDVKNMTNGKKTSITHSVPTNVVFGAVHLSGGTLSTSTAASLLIHRIKIIKYEN